MEKTPPCGLNRKFLTLIYIILFQFSVLWFGPKHYFHVIASPLPLKYWQLDFHHLDQTRGHLKYH